MKVLIDRMCKGVALTLCIGYIVKENSYVIIRLYVYIPLWDAVGDQLIIGSRIKRYKSIKVGLETGK